MSSIILQGGGSPLLILQGFGVGGFIGACAHADFMLVVEADIGLEAC